LIVPRATSGLVRRRSRDDLHARVEVCVVDELGLSLLDDPAGNPLAEERLIAHDLVRPLVSRHQRDEEASVLVRLVDREGVEGDQIAQCVGDSLENGVQLLLREDDVEDVGKTPVRVDQRVDSCQGRAG
jgi:hypothetical protein